MADVVPDKSDDDGMIILQPATKFSIIDDELNRYGMGLYHWLVWTICGTGFFLDAMWVQALAFASSSIQHEFGFSDKEFANITVALAAGMIVGSFTWGVLVDVVGRRIAFLGTSLIAGVFGMCLGAVPSYNGLLPVIACVGLGIGGNVPIDSTITVEYIPKNRFYLLTALSIFLPLGTVSSTLIAFGLMPPYSCSSTLVSCNLTGGAEPCCSRGANMGWRYLFFTVASITLGVFIIRFFIFPFYESPKFLVSKGNDRDAVEIVRKIAVFNKRPCNLSVESLYERSGEHPNAEENGFSRRFISEISRLKLLFGNWKMIRITVLVWITWMFDYWGAAIANAFLPTILQRKNSAIHVSLKETYIDYVIINTSAIASVILSVLMVRAPLIGRKWTLVLSSMMMGISLFLYSIVDTEASYVSLNVLEFFCLLFFNSTLFGWTPEAFPTAVRGTATGLSSVCGALLGTFAPLVAEQLFDRVNGSNAVLYLAGSGVFVCTLALLCLPTEDMVASQ